MNLKKLTPKKIITNWLFDNEFDIVTDEISIKPIHDNNIIRLQLSWTTFYLFNINKKTFTVPYSSFTAYDKEKKELFDYLQYDLSSKIPQLYLDIRDNISYVFINAFKLFDYTIQKIKEIRNPIVSYIEFKIINQTLDDIQKKISNPLFKRNSQYIRIRTFEEQLESAIIDIFEIEHKNNKYFRILFDRKIFSLNNVSNLFMDKLLAAIYNQFQDINGFHVIKSPTNSHIYIVHDSLFQ